MRGELASVRWGWIVAAVCLALLAWFRATDARPLAAVVCAAAAVGTTLLALRPHRRTEPLAADHSADREQTSPPPDPTRIARTLDWHRARGRAWLATAVLGWGAALLGAVLFPPLALVAAAAAAFAIMRYRQARVYTQTLAAVLPQLRDQPPSDGGGLAAP